LNAHNNEKHMKVSTKGDHLIKEDSARKLFHVKKLGKGPDVFRRLVTKGE